MTDHEPLAPSSGISNTKGPDTEEGWQGEGPEGRPGDSYNGKMKPAETQSPSREGEGLLQEERMEDGRPSSSPYLELVCRIYQGPEIKFSR